MRVLYRDSAESDLENIKNYYITRSPEGLKAVLQDITGTIEIIKNHPDVGAKVFQDRRVRRLATAKYGYCIAYLPQADVVEIIGVFRYQNRDV